MDYISRYNVYGSKRLFVVEYYLVIMLNLLDRLLDFVFLVINNGELK